MAVFDLDQTLLQDDKTLDKRTIKAVLDLKNQGVKIAVATGRNYEMAKPFANMIGADHYVACNNGGLIYDIHTDACLKTQNLTPKALSYVIDKAESEDLVYVVYGSKGVHLTSEAQRFDVYRDWNTKHPESPVHVFEAEDASELKKLESHKVLYVIEDPVKMAQTHESLQTIQDISFTKSSIDYLDIMPPNTSKANALRYFMNQYDVNADEVIAFGDNDNDAAMLRAVPFSFAMLNGTIKAKEAATFQTRFNNNQQGVADILENLNKYIG